MSKHFIAGVAATFIAASVPFGAAQAASCLPGPLTIMVNHSPGGGLDLLARTVGEVWGKLLGVNVIIQNVEGASGAIGLVQAYRAPADGTMVVSWSPPGEYVLQLQGRVPFTMADWDLIGATNSDPGSIIVPADSPYKTLNDLLTASKGEKRLSAGSAGRNTIGGLEALMYENVFDVKWGLVPFDGASPLMTALLGHHLDLAVREGGIYDMQPEKIRVLAVAAEQRIAEMPDVPTFEEAAGKKILYAATRGFAVRKGTPPETLKCLRDTFNQAAQSPEIADQQYKKIGFRYQFLDAAAFEEVSDTEMKLADEFKHEFLGE